MFGVPILSNSDSGTAGRSHKKGAALLRYLYFYICLYRTNSMLGMEDMYYG